MIAAIPSEAKVLTYMLLRRLTVLLHPHIPGQQTGFAPKARVEAAVLGVTTFLHYHKTHTNTHCLVTAIDLEKAFDTVDRGILLAKLASAGVPRSLCSLLASYFDKTCVVLPGGIIPYKRGVVQGCVMSPLLFALYTSEVATCCAIPSPHPSISPYQSNQQAPSGERLESAPAALDGLMPPRFPSQVLYMYADDMILASTTATLQAEGLAAIEQAVHNTRLRIHPQKSQTLICNIAKHRKANGSEDAAAHEIFADLKEQLANRHSCLSEMRHLPRIRYLGYNIARSGLAHAVSKTSPGKPAPRGGVAVRLQRASAQQRPTPRVMIDSVKRLLIPNLDWSYAIPAAANPQPQVNAGQAHGPRARAPLAATLGTQDKQDDNTVVDSLGAAIFGPMTTGRRRILSAAVLLELGITPAATRRAGLAAGVLRMQQCLPAGHPTRSMLQMDHAQHPQSSVWTILHKRSGAGPETAQGSPNLGAPTTTESQASALRVTTATLQQHASGRWLAQTLLNHGRKPPYGRVFSPRLRLATLKLRCNTNTYMPGDAMPILSEGQTTYCTHPSCTGLRDTLSHRVLCCPEIGHLCRRGEAVAKLAQTVAGLDTMLVRSTREEQESRQHLFPRAPPPESTSSIPPAVTTSTPSDAADTAERMLTPLVWGDTKAILGLLPDGLSPGDTALTLTKLLTIAWALTASTIDSQKSKLPQPPATIPAPPNLGTPR